MGLRDQPLFRQPHRTVHDLGEASTALVWLLDGILDANGEEVCMVAAKGLAQLSFETATFASCWNENVGNLRTPGGRTDRVPFTLIPGGVDEYIDGQRFVARREDDKLRIFAAYEDLEQGLRAWLDLIRHSYGFAWGKLVNPYATVEDFVGALAADPAHRYYTASPTLYAKGAKSRHAICLAACLGEKLARVIRLGAHGEDVERWQYMLEKAGFPVNDADGVYGEPTWHATKAWQTAHGLVDNGVVGPVSLEAMGMSPFARAA